MNPGGALSVRLSDTTTGWRIIRTITARSTDRRFNSARNSDGNGWRGARKGMITSEAVA